jgi:hypothetical protein
VQPAKDRGDAGKLVVERDIDLHDNGTLVGKGARDGKASGIGREGSWGGRLEAQTQPALLGAGNAQVADVDVVSV